MKTRLVIFLMIVCGFVSVASASVYAQAQDEVDVCDTAALSTILSTYAESIAGAPYDDVVIISAEIGAILDTYANDCNEPAATVELETEAEAASTFLVRANGNVNIRSCGDTTCGIVTAATNGQIFTVVGQDGDWYEIDLGDGETGFIASWLTVRGPDAYIDVYEGYNDSTTGCRLMATVSRSSTNSFAFAMSGDRWREIVVDIYRPNTTTAETVFRQRPSTFIDSGKDYIYQSYLSTYWPEGTYQVLVNFDGLEKNFSFDLNRAGETVMHVICN